MIANGAINFVVKGVLPKVAATEAAIAAKKGVEAVMSGQRGTLIR